MIRRAVNSIANRAAKKSCGHRRAFAMLAVPFLLCRFGGCGRTPDAGSGAIGEESPSVLTESVVTPGAQAAPNGIYISEVCPGNHAGLQAPDGQFYDWAELYNANPQATDIGGCMIMDGDGNNFRIPEGTGIAGNSYLVIYLGNAASPEAGGLFSGFSLKREGDRLRLSAPGGETLDETEWPEVEKENSWCRNGPGDAGEFSRSDMPTPGAENTEEAYRSLCSGAYRDSPLLISEVVLSGSRLVGEDGETHDWVEIVNVSGEPVSLADYYLCDDDHELPGFKLPDFVLAPGEYAVIFCDDSYSSASAADLAVPFSLSSKGESIFLSGAESQLCDWCFAKPCLMGNSYGRSPESAAFLFFSEPTPGAANTSSGAWRYSERPEAEPGSRLLREACSFDVALTAPGKIFYTLDGSRPTENSMEYTGPIQVADTTVIRAVCLSEGCLPGEEIALSYIFEPDNTLDVVSLISDPYELFGENKDGAYYDITKTKESPATAMLLTDEGELFSAGCGIKRQGNKQNPEVQPGLRLTFSNRYGGPVSGAFFGPEADTYQAINLRTGFSREHYLIADVVYTELAREYCQSLLMVDNRYVNVYVNGQYWGFYQMRERQNEAYFAKQWQVSKESVEIIRADELRGTELEALIKSLKTADLSDPAQYEEFSSKFDVRDFSEWMVIQAFCGNLDHRVNVKWVRSSEYDGKWHTVLFDMDRAFITERGFDMFDLTGVHELTAIKNALIKNREYCSLLSDVLLRALSTSLTTENTLAVLQRNLDAVGDEPARSLVRWKYPRNIWPDAVEKLAFNIQIYKMPESLKRSAGTLFKHYPDLYAEFLEQAG